MSGGIEGQFELFPDDPARRRRPRGRPPFEKTTENQWLVSAMLRQGSTVEEIADRLGISVPTLRRIFSTSPYWNPRGKGPRICKKDKGDG